MLLTLSTWIFTDNAIAQTLLNQPERDPQQRDAREIVVSALNYLQRMQNERGTWIGGEAGPGTTSLALLAFLSAGEDPNFGPYSSSIRKALGHVVRSQDAKTGYMGPSMYHHGFSMLAVAEAYGAIDESVPTFGGEGGVLPRSLGQSLELSVRCAIASQKKNPLKAWRYSPDSRDADTSVSGAVLMGLLAARNAGIEVPDESIDSAVDFFTRLSTQSGTVAYTSNLDSFGDSIARSSIALLVLNVAKRRDEAAYTAILKFVASAGEEAGGWPEYARYYRAQALFQGDIDSWETWNKTLIRKLKSAQEKDGSFRGSLGPANDTSMSVLALALNFKFLPIYER